MKAILLPGNSLKFPLVKVIVSKIAYKSLKTTKNSHFLRTDHRNVVHENFFRDFGDIICIKNLFRPIRVINRTNSWAIWTRIGEDIDHFSKWPANPPPKKKFPFFRNFLIYIYFSQANGFSSIGKMKADKTAKSFPIYRSLAFEVW